MVWESVASASPTANQLPSELGLKTIRTNATLPALPVLVEWMWLHYGSVLSLMICIA